MPNLVLPVSRDLIRQGCPGVTEDLPELAVETLRIKLERCLALSAKAQIGIHLHGSLLVGAAFFHRLRRTANGIDDPPDVVLVGPRVDEACTQPEPIVEHGAR